MPGDELIEVEPLFAAFAERRGLGLAVSGGPDSLALLLLAARWRAGRDHAPPIFVYSVDHGLRPEAADEVQLVCREAARLGLSARALHWGGSKPRTGVQEAARRARYRLIGAAMAADGADLLLTAHHLEDQAETVLMRLAHGSGLGGLGGMQPLSMVEGVAIARPLLGVPKARLAELVAQSGLRPVSDPSNADHSYERVRWRAALPALAELGLSAERLALFAGRAHAAQAAIEVAAAEALRCWAVPGPAGLTLEARRLAGLPRAVRVEVLARVLGEVGGHRKPHALAAVEALADRLAGAAALKRTSLHGCLIDSDGETVVVGREPGRSISSPAITAN